MRLGQIGCEGIWGEKNLSSFVIEGIDSRAQNVYVGPPGQLQRDSQAPLCLNSAELVQLKTLILLNLRRDTAGNNHYEWWA